MYEIEGTKWVKKDVEGTLFVVKRTQNPRFKMIVLNRNSPTNFEQVVDGTVAIKQMDKVREREESMEGKGEGRC